MVLYTSSSYSGYILTEEITQAKTNGELALMEAVISEGSRELYAMSKQGCGSKRRAALCLFFYTYALQRWNASGNNYLSEPQLSAILSCIEQTSKTCCNG